MTLLQHSSPDAELGGGTVIDLTSREAIQTTTSIVIPAHNEAETVGDVVLAVRRAAGPGTEVLVVDDGSTDETAARAEAAGAVVIRRPYRYGNGAAIKAGVRAAKGTRVLMLDADGQHDTSQIPELLDALSRYDMVVAARSASSHASRGRRLANACFNWLASRLSGHRIADLTSGYRAIRADVFREFLPLLPNQFSYPTTITLAALKAGYSVLYVPTVAAKRPGTAKSKIKPARDSLRFFTIIFKIVTLYSPLRIFAPLSSIPAAAGLPLLVSHLVRGHGGTTTDVLLLTMALFIFCIGLISEQINSLRFERIGRHELP